MATLTQSAIVARKGVRYVLYGLIFLIFVRAVYNLGSGIYRKYFPTPPPTPTVSFGKLPKLPFPESKGPKDLAYTIETPDGKLPKLPPQMKVYFMPSVNSSIGALDNAKEKAKNLGFDPNGKILVENVPNVYVFSKKDAPSTLTMNIVTGVFSVSYDINSDPSIIGQTPPSPASATKQVQAFLGRGKYLEADISGPVTNEFLKIVNRELQKVSSQSEADFVKVNLFRSNIEEKIPSLPPNPKEANVWFILSGSQEKEKQIFAGEYHYFAIDKEKSGTYPIMTPEEAVDTLKRGEAYIANIGNVSGKNITVRRIFLAYFDPEQYTEFAQPIFVFEGDEDFTAYVPAISPKFYGSEEKKQ